MVFVPAEFSLSAGLSNVYCRRYAGAFATFVIANASRGRYGLFAFTAGTAEMLLESADLTYYRSMIYGIALKIFIFFHIYPMNHLNTSMAMPYIEDDK